LTPLLRPSNGCAEAALENRRGAIVKAREIMASGRLKVERGAITFQCRPPKSCAAVANVRMVSEGKIEDG
jgi:hypothetical protein